MRRSLICLAVVLLAFSFTFLVLGQASAISRAPTVPTAPDEAILDIPYNEQVPEIDGDCASEYAMSPTRMITYPDGNTATIHFQHNYNSLYVCLEAPAGTFDRRFVSLYLDPQGDGAGYNFARKDDFGLWLNVQDTLSDTVRGSDVADGWVDAPDMDSEWEGVAGSTANGDFAEWRVLLDTFDLQLCRLIGVAVYHHSVNSEGDDHGYPSNQWYDQPRTWQPARLIAPDCADPAEGRIAYVFRGDRADASSFYNLLTANGYTVDLIPFSDILATNFDDYDLILIADDTGFLDEWGEPGQTAAQVAQITAPEPDVPIIGLGEGGYAFFGQLGLFIGWPNGWHRPEAEVYEASTAPPDYYPASGGPVYQLYTDPVNEVGIYLGKEDTIPSDVTVFGLEPPNLDHAPHILQGCRHLWGYSGNPDEMTFDGEQTFLNAVAYMRNFQCQREIPPPETCYSIEKIADPPAGTPVQPGDTISYTINYVWSNDPDCRTAGQQTTVIDYVPFDTIFVPGSATGGITPQADGALVWPVTPAAGSQQVQFQVWVMDTSCRNQRTINNEARLLVPFASTIGSGIVSHPVECPDIVFPNDEPPYAEEEVQIYPYPLVSNQPSTISVKISNMASVAKTVIVKFQASPDRFGIGLTFNTFSQEMVTIPANSSVIVKTTYTPVVPGHYCIQVVVQGTAPGDPVIKTQRNLDVTEDLQPGVPDDLVFKVGNPTGTTADVQLVVDNNCPGWTATVSPEVLEDMAPGEVRDATLTVTPPDPMVLGTTCHIDVQGWIGGKLIGGIRKLDVPPVHLPVDVEPPYMEQEISTIPDPPVVGQPGQFCVELQNPLGTPRTVVLDFAEADFGAGIWFTSVGTRTVTLPANSIADYCIDWTPREGGTLHRCLLVTLMQEGYHDQRSQRNVEVVEGTMSEIAELDLPLLVHNPDLGPHELTFDIRTYGLGPQWRIDLIRENGMALPAVIEAGETLDLMLGLTPETTGLQPLGSDLPDYGFGDEIRIEVDVVMDGAFVGGFAYVLETPEEHELFLPIINRH